MEVSRKREGNFSRKSECLGCTPCSQDRKYEKPEAFCTSCEEFLCFVCAKVHRNQRITRHHALLENSEMPSSIVSDFSNEGICTEICSGHPSEFVKYYCTSHLAFLCGDCVIREHRNCEVEHIPNACKDYRNGVEYTSIVGDITTLDYEFKYFKSALEKSIHSAQHLGAQQKQAIQDYKFNLFKRIEQSECKLIDKIEEIKTKDETRLTTMKARIPGVLSSINSIKSTLHSKNVNSSQLYVEAKRAKQEVAKLRLALDRMNKENTIQKYRFKGDILSESMLATNNALGSIKEDDNDDDALTDTTDHDLITDCDDAKDFCGQLLPFVKKLPGINASIPSDWSFCCLNSLQVLPNDRLLATDQENACIKLFNTKTNLFMSHLKLAGKPSDSCIVPSHRVAVTLPMERQIHIVDTQEELILVDRFTVNGSCRGIAYYDERFIVSYTELPRVEILDVNGETLEIVSNASLHSQIFQYPNHLRVETGYNQSFIYVSDQKANMIIKLNMSLQVINTFSGESLRAQGNICGAGENILLVCATKNNGIVALETKSGNMKTIFGQNDEIAKPIATCVCCEHNRIFISNDERGKSDIILVFEGKLKKSTECSHG
ncbi:TRI45-like protein [Mya arenaria]|uniref:TRI45-like protein n=1 Tax=Mya arenaria TaxID=6604 RepID=A0ABY7FV59_MYAAR|nr:uncharacterized protein LOC128216820 isoform X1 [Mya arenaria]WAR26032.1 TRI45-like protein [Mya arenaria]